MHKTSSKLFVSYNNQSLCLWVHNFQELQTQHYTDNFSILFPMIHIFQSGGFKF